MKIVYDSLTGLGKTYAESLGYPTVDINEVDDADVQSKYFLVTRCFNFGEVPESTVLFLRKHYRQVIGVACGGNRNWGANYAIAGDKIEQTCRIPCVSKFEAMGFEHERQQSREFIENYLSQHPEE